MGLAVVQLCSAPRRQVILGALPPDPRLCTILGYIGGGAYGGEPKVPLPYERQAPSGAVMEYVRALEWALTMTRGDC